MTGKNPAGEKLPENSLDFSLYPLFLWINGMAVGYDSCSSNPPRDLHYHGITKVMQPYNSPSYAPPPAASRPRKKLMIWLLLGVIALPLIYFGLNLAVVVFGVQPVRMAGQSMSPNINDGDKLFMLKQIGELRRGDIVVFLFPEDQTKSYIKRIVGLPGETVEIKEGKVFINGNQIEEPYLNPDFVSQDSMPSSVTIAADNYFVLGDNRNNSSDSRYWGAVPRKLIYGKFWRRYYQAKQGE